MVLRAEHRACRNVGGVDIVGAKEEVCADGMDIESEAEDACTITTAEGMAQCGSKVFTDTEVCRCGKLRDCIELAELCMREQAECNPIIKEVILYTYVNSSIKAAER